jgi:hypothetical protein
VNHELASAALMLDAKHWMVVHGWEDRGRHPGLSAIVVDGQRVTDLYLRDPNWDFNQRIDIDWFTGLQYQVDCGTFNGRFVMVARP